MTHSLFTDPQDALDWVLTRLASVLNLERDRLGRLTRFRDLGVSSNLAIQLTSEWGRELDRPLPTTLFWDFAHIEALAGFLFDPARASDEKTFRYSGQGNTQPIAIVGMSCRLPGDVNSPADFWEILQAGVDAVGEVPHQRIDLVPYYDPMGGRSGTTNSKYGGFLRDVAGFDNDFWGISPRESLAMDPQQRLMLELAWETLEDAGTDPAALRKRPVGVYVGAMWRDYAALQPLVSDIAQHSATGLDSSIIAARISYGLGLMGPSMTVNTACSASLVSVHLACQSLHLGESEMALAGGINLILAPHSIVAMAQFGGLSGDGRVKAFAEAADGYVRGEGGGFVLLKPLSSAIADGDRIYSLIMGSAVNNDGPSNGLTSPNPGAQREVLRRAYATAGIDPARVTYVEAHGTGTLLGDPIEANALGTELGLAPGREQALRIGSCKTNIGHLETGAGIAGLIKTALSIQARRLPPSLHCRKPNPHIAFDRLNLRVQTELTFWPHDETAIAGVSSFGFGGTNCHVVLSEAMPVVPLPVVLGAPDAPTLDRRTAALCAFLDSPANDPVSLADIARSVAPGPADTRCLPFLVASRQELRARLRDESQAPIQLEQAAPLVFVFSGQGANWQGMARDLLVSDPVFATAIGDCDRFFHARTGQSLLPALAAGQWEHGDTRLYQGLLFAVQVGLVALWRDWGLVPEAVVGHSLGELAAAWTAGALSLEDAVTVVVQRSILMAEVAGLGGMLLLDLSPTRTAALLKQWPWGGELDIAAENAPETTVLAGVPDTLTAFAAFAAEAGITCRRLDMNIACHGRQMAPLSPRLAEALGALRPQPPHTLMISSVSGETLTLADAAYWVANFTRPVRFAKAMDNLLDRGLRHFLEIGPHPILSASMQRQLDHREIAGRLFCSLRRSENGPRCLRQELLHLLPTQRLHWHRILPAEAKARPIPGFAGEVTSKTEAILLPLSASSTNALRQKALDLADLMEKNGPDPIDLMFSTGSRVGHHMFRLCLLSQDRQEAIHQLRAPTDAADLFQARVDPSRGPKVVFVFPGQGSQWLGMGRRLFEEEPAFRSEINACAAAFERHCTWSLREQLFAGEETSLLGRVDVVQPVLFAIEVALAAIWRTWGIEPDAVIGHSMGEIAAAHVAGVLSLDDAARIICRRSQLVKSLGGTGAMALVALTPEEMAPFLKAYPNIAIAAHNGPSSILLSGQKEPLQGLLAELTQQEIFGRFVDVDYASHCAHMDPLLDELRANLDLLEPRHGKIPVYSTVTCEPLHGGEMDGRYWADNLRRPVLFHEALQRLLEDHYNVFIEMSPHPVLVPAIANGADFAEVRAEVCFSLKRGEEERANLLHNLARLYTLGLAINWQAVCRGRGRPVPLPRYPWQQQRFWPEPAVAKPDRDAEQTGQHPLLGRLLDTPLKQRIYENRLSLAAVPFLGEHLIHGLPIYPATAFLETAWAAARAFFGHTRFRLDDFSISHALPLKGATTYVLQTILTPEENGRLQWRIFCRPEEIGSRWLAHAEGYAALDDVQPAPVSLTPLPARPPEAFYALLAGAGLDYGPAFRRITRLHADPGRAHACVAAPGPAVALSGFHFHPAWLDACLHTYFACLPPAALVGSLYLPVHLKKFQVFGQPQGMLTVTTRQTEAGGDLLRFDIAVYNEDGTPVATLVGQGVQRTDAHLLRQAGEHRAAQMFFASEWSERPLSPDHRQGRLGRHYLFFADAGDLSASLADRLRRLDCQVTLVERGDRFIMNGNDTFTLDPFSPGDFDRLFEKLSGNPPDRLLFLWALGAVAEPGETSLDLLEPLCAANLHLIGSLMRQLTSTDFAYTIVTMGGVASGHEAQAVNPHQAALHALARVAALEHPELNVRVIDLAHGATADQVDPLLAELRSNAAEFRVAYRDGNRLVARLASYAPGSQEHASRLGASPSAMSLRLPRGSYRIHTSGRGFLENLQAQPWEPPPLAAAEVEIRVAATGLNFRDVMNALGTYPGDAGFLGLECAGEVLARGTEVSAFQPGDRVLAFSSGCFADRIRVPACFVAKIPGNLPFAAAAGIPIVFMTALYGLVRLAGLKAGEKVLIHAAAGGVGLAALALARGLGAEIFATAGSPEKRAFLRRQGIEHVMNSRDLDFADQIIGLTGGKGVDVVLNSLAGDFIGASFAATKNGGRFIELGKTGIWSPERVAALDRGIDYHPFDLVQLAGEQKDLISTLLAEVTEGLAAGRLQPVPVTLFPLANLAGACRWMARGKHLGKIVLAHTRTGQDQPQLRRDGLYLISGGTGSLGLLCAEALAEWGAGHLILLSRSKTAADLGPRLDAIKRFGTRVTVMKADFNQPAEITRALTRAKAKGLLRGVVHAAGLLSDGILMHQKWEDFRRAVVPKVLGGALLHELCADQPLDFFICYSSAAAALGSPGQAGYAVANAFLDALAAHRRAYGLPALSIQWGPWSGVGLAAAGDRRGLDHWRRLGVGAVDPESGKIALGLLLRDGAACTGVFPLNRTLLTASGDPFYAELTTLPAEPTADAATGDQGEALAALTPGMPPKQARKIIYALVANQFRQVMGQAPSHAVDPDRGFREMGLDSLMTVAFRNRLTRIMGVALPATLAFNYPNLNALTDFLLLRLQPETPRLAGEEPEKPADAATTADLEGLSDDDLAHMIEDEFSEFL